MAKFWYLCAIFVATIGIALSIKPDLNLFQTTALDKAALQEQVSTGTRTLGNLRKSNDLQVDELSYLLRVFGLIHKLSTGALKPLHHVRPGESVTSAAAIVAVVGSDSVRTRGEDEPFLSAPTNEALQTLVSASAGFVSAVERLSGRLPHAFELRVAKASAKDSPYVIWNVTSGVVTLNSFVLPYLATLQSDFFNNTFQKMSADVAAMPEEVGAAATCVAIAQRIVGYLQESIWECIVCIVVLAIGLPLAANFLLAAMMEQLCDYFGWPAQTCTDLVLSALVLVDILLPLFAYVIVKACKLQAGACTQSS
eukprot:TRINITY_DN8756_c0_g1_i1.p1 TRINITY_DN8756_c0_g1~~TRINITY_DN8756_c0_g1_i1.p1  ORF type:complete len:325 (-),score=51.22 TRINITY_DN8756_c0_g1_i1:43-972(-)